VIVSHARGSRRGRLPSLTVGPFNSEGTGRRIGSGEPSLTRHRTDDEWLLIEVIAGGHGAPVRLVIAGELERGTSDRLRDTVAGIVGTRAPVQLQINADKVSFLDSAGIRCLLLCRDDARAAGTRLSIVDPAPLVTWTLHIAGLLEVFGLPVPTAPAPMGSRTTVPAARRWARQPMPMSQLLAQSAAIRRDARETRQRAEAMSYDDALHRIRIGMKIETPSS
jgi:stage II sporulation protein AA (anti-sigma F factor antagonist)